MLTNTDSQGHKHEKKQKKITKSPPEVTVIFPVHFFFFFGRKKDAGYFYSTLNNPMVVSDLMYFLRDLLQRPVHLDHRTNFPCDCEARNSHNGQH